MKKRIRATIQAQPKPSINDWFKHIHTEICKIKGISEKIAEPETQKNGKNVEI